MELFKKLLMIGSWRISNQISLVDHWWDPRLKLCIYNSSWLWLELLNSLPKLKWFNLRETLRWNIWYNQILLSQEIRKFITIAPEEAVQNSCFENPYKKLFIGSWSTIMIVGLEVPDNLKCD